MHCLVIFGPISNLQFFYALSANQFCCAMEPHTIRGNNQLLLSLTAALTASLCRFVLVVQVVFYHNTSHEMIEARL